jgi:perosamine synthetase
MDFIPVCEPYLNGNEKKYADDCLNTGWISSAGKYVSAFEEQFAHYCGVRFGVGVCNGTVALHLALTALGITKGDEVIVPNFTMIASAFAICYTGAMPVFVDAEPETWNIDTNRIEEKITRRTRAIMPVSIFGHPCNMDAINALARKYNLTVVEDAAESHGAEYKGKKTGALADITAFSFFANKNITTGEGGMVVTDNEDLYNKAKYYKNLCFPLNAPRNYIHEHIGFQYRMTNIQAAIGLAQTEKANEYKAMRIKNAILYRQYLKDVPGVIFQQTKDYAVNVHWMNAVIIEPDKYGENKDELMAYLRTRNVDTRLLFVGMNRQPALQRYGCDVSGDYPVTQWLSDNGFYLPSASNLTEEKIKYICEQIITFHNS